MKQQYLSEMKKLIDICHSNLKNSKECLNYLYDRGVSDEVIGKYKIGFFPQNTNTLSKYVSPEFMRKASVMNYSGYSPFADRYFLILPIHNEYREPIAIIGRTLLDEHQRSLLGLSKYKNSSYKKSKNLYNLENARSAILKKQNCFVVEGNFDAITVASNGIPNVVGICGAAFSRHHLYKLARYTDKITFLLDRDDGGKIAMQRISKKFANKGMKLRFYNLPEGVKDVDDYFNKAGGTRESLLREIKPFIPTW